MSEARSNIPSWGETFMNISQVIALRSKDPSTQVGATIVNADNKILSVGYNGTPKGFDDDIFPWGRDNEDPMLTKYPFVVHAERNAILNFNGALRDFKGATLYTTHFPCNECAKEIAQVQIAHVVFLNSHSMTDGLSPATLKIFDMANITLKQLEI